MDPSPRHQCLIYQGAPSRHLPALAAILLGKLQQNYRCLYLNSPPMIAAIRPHLAAAGLDVAHEIRKTSLVLSSDHPSLAVGSFEVEPMIHTLEASLNQAIRDGYAGLFATGDMTWEMGGEKDPSKLLEYEWRLEKLFHERPQLSGICQYHAGTLPPEMMRHSLLVHASIFISERLSLTNPHYMHPESLVHEFSRNATLDSAVAHLCQLGDVSEA
jgi:hypothetical protein